MKEKFEDNLRSNNSDLLSFVNKCNFFIFLCALLVFGIVLNFYAITGNGGRMPVYYSYESSYEFETNSHFSYNNFSDVSYPYLSDIFGIKFFKFSIGDVMILVGSIGILVSLFHFRKLIKRIKKTLEETPDVAGKYS